MASQPNRSLRVPVWARYEEELAPIASRLPAGARKYALAAWHCDITDHRCIHDASVEVISVVEAGSGNAGEQRAMGIVIRLLAAHRDRHLLLKLTGVRRYTIEHPSPSTKMADRGHGDVLDDAIRLTPEGHVVYSLNMESGRLEVEAKDIEFSQQPI